jgi:uncharacterized membrane protein YczE
MKWRTLITSGAWSLINAVCVFYGRMLPWRIANMVFAILCAVVFGMEIGEHFGRESWRRK